MTRVVVVATGLANTASVLAGLRRIGAEPELSTDPSFVRSAPAVVLPGVGAFGAGMRALREHGLVEALLERIADDRPTAGICLGMQLLCATSDESVGVRGLGVIETHVGSFSPTLHVPQMGWNRVEPEHELRFIQAGYAYFANSFRISEAPSDWRVATADYGGRFVAAMERGNVLGCQFHPELSGRFGLGLLSRWLNAAGLPC